MNEDLKQNRVNALRKGKEQAKLNDELFKNNSLEIKIRKWVVRRDDSLNFTVHYESESEKGNVTKKYYGFYLTLYRALRRFYSEIKNIERADLKEELFQEFKEIKPEQGTKDLNKKVTDLINKMLKERVSKHLKAKKTRK